jgi:hypothetical protein
MNTPQNEDTPNMDRIAAAYPDETFLQADGLDGAIIGIDDATMRLVYSKEKAIEIMAKEFDDDYECAIEYLEFNTFGAYVGEQTPLWVTEVPE